MQITTGSLIIGCPVHVGRVCDECARKCTHVHRHTDWTHAHIHMWTHAHMNTYTHEHVQTFGRGFEHDGRIFVDSLQMQLYSRCVETRASKQKHTLFSTTPRHSNLVPRPLDQGNIQAKIRG